jgi:hypothetical protein
MFRFSLLVLLSLLTPLSLAQQSELSPEYLAGIWSLAGPQGCEGRSADYALFRENGTLELGTAGKPRAAGFWEINNDAVIVHLLVSPSGDQTHSFYQSSYFYQYRTARVLSLRANVFSVRIGGSDQGEELTLTRCQ